VGEVERQPQRKIRSTLSLYDQDLDGSSWVWILYLRDARTRKIPLKRRTHEPDNFSSVATGYHHMARCLLGPRTTPDQSGYHMRRLTKGSSRAKRSVRRSLSIANFVLPRLPARTVLWHRCISRSAAFAGDNTLCLAIWFHPLQLSKRTNQTPASLLQGNKCGCRPLRRRSSLR